MLFICWGALALVGLACWPLLLRLGWTNEPSLLGWARPAGLLLLGGTCWLLGHLLPVSWALGIAMALLGALGVWAGLRRRLMLCQTLKTHWRALLVGEGLFVVTSACVLWLRGWAPGVAHTEQPMDMAFLASCLRTVRLPPSDPWLAGEPINYYYLGYFIWGLLARLLAIPATIAYNLSLAITAGLTAQALYGLLLRCLCTARRGFAAAYSAAGALLVLVAGNLALFAESLHARGVLPQGIAVWLGIPGLAQAPMTGSLQPGADWWWRVSRPWRDLALPGRSGEVIVEFPAFSFVLGDLHPHLMALPFSVAAVGLLLTAPVPLTMGRAVALGLMIGGVGLVNGWELPMLLGLLVLWQVLSARAGRASWRSTGTGLGTVLAAALLPCLAFFGSLESQVSGVGVSWLAKTPLRSYLLALGGWVLPALGWIWMRRRYAPHWWRWGAGLLGATAVAILACGGVGRLLLSLVGLVRGAALAILLLTALALLCDWLWREPQAQDAAPPLLLLMGFGLTYVAEQLYVVDLFGTRMNTVFKFYYQAWWLIAVAALTAMAAWLQRSGRRRAVSVSVLIVWLLLTGYMPLAAPRAEGDWSLDALTPLAQYAPDEAAAVVWLRQNASPGDVLLAAPGENYDPASVRLSALSGVPMVLGWPGHERQWGRTAALIDARERDIAVAYTSLSQQERAAILQRHGVTLVLLGDRERALYGKEAVREENWLALCEPAFEAQALRLLRCQP